jgi:hypothetical protein
LNTGPPSSTPNHEFAWFLTFVVNEIKHLARSFDILCSGNQIGLMCWQ